MPTMAPLEALYAHWPAWPSKAAMDAAHSKLKAARAEAEALEKAKAAAKSAAKNKAD